MTPIAPGHAAARAMERFGLTLSPRQTQENAYAGTD